MVRALEGGDIAPNLFTLRHPKPISHGYVGTGPPGSGRDAKLLVNPMAQEVLKEGVSCNVSGTVVLNFEIFQQAPSFARKSEVRFLLLWRVPTIAKQLLWAYELPSVPNFFQINTQNNLSGHLASLNSMRSKYLGT